MARADKDPRPPIELWESEPVRDEASHVQEVTVGPAGGGRRLWIGLLVAAAVLVIAGVALGGDDGGPDEAAALEDTEDSDERPRRSSTSSTATTTEPEASDSDSEPDPPEGPVLEPGAGPVFGRPVGAAVLIADEDGATWFDLDTGNKAILDELDNLFYVLPVNGGIVTDIRGVPTYVSMPFGEHVHLSDFPATAHAGGDEAVWLVNGEVATLVDLTGSILVPPFPLPFRPWDLQGTAAGLVTAIGGQVVVIGPEGLRPLGSGELMGVSGEWVAIWTCDEQLDCRVMAVNATSDERRVFGSAGDVSRSERLDLVSPDGNYVARAGPEGDWNVQIVRDDQSVVAELPSSGDMAWLPDSSGVLVRTNTGGHALLDIASGTATPADPGVVPDTVSWHQLVPHAR